MGPIIGIAIGGLIAVTLILVAAWFFLWRRRRQSQGADGKGLSTRDIGSPTTPELPIQRGLAMLESGLITPVGAESPQPPQQPSVIHAPLFPRPRSRVNSIISSYYSHSRHESVASSTTPPMVPADLPKLTIPTRPAAGAASRPMVIFYRCSHAIEFY